MLDPMVGSGGLLQSHSNLMGEGLTSGIKNEERIQKQVTPPHKAP